MKKVERQTKSVEPTAEMFIEAFSVGVKIAEKKRKEDNTDNRRYTHVRVHVHVLYGHYGVQLCCTCTCV